MACLFLDGMDKYGPPGQTTPTVASLLTAGEYTSLGSAANLTIVAGLSGTGNALSIHPTGASAYDGPVRALGSNVARIIGGVRFSIAATDANAGSAAGIEFRDGATAQCGITIDAAGTISLRAASNNSSTALATSSATVTTGSTHYLEWDITIGASSAYALYLDGAATPIVSGTGNTRQGTANNYCTQVHVGGRSSSSSTGPTFTYDDLYLFDATGATCNAVLLNNPLIETALPSGDVQKQWTAGATIIGTDNSATATTNAPGANQIFLRSFTAPCNMTLNSVSCTPMATAGAANFKAVLYAGITAGSARIAEGTAVTGTTSGATLTAPFAAGQSLTGGTAYTIGFITDTSVVLAQSDTGTTGSRAANTYTSNSPATLPAMTTGQANWKLWGNATGGAVNYASLVNNPAIDDIAFVNDSTVNHEDLYSFPALSSNPASISVVAYKARVKRSDSGSRTVDVRCLSSASDSAGSASGFTPATSFGWVDTHFPTDPNTGVAWTGSAINAASAGPKVAS